MTPAAFNPAGPQAARRYAETARQAQSQDPSRTPARARMSKRSIGFRLGGFGLSYESEDVRLEPVSAPRAGFEQNIETAALRREMVVEAASQTLANLPPQRRAGIRAYQDALAPAPQTGRSLLGVA